MSQWWSENWKKCVAFVLAFTVGPFILVQCSGGPLPSVKDRDPESAVRELKEAGYHRIVVEDIDQNPIPKSEFSAQYRVVRMDPDAGYLVNRWEEVRLRVAKERPTVKPAVSPTAASRRVPVKTPQVLPSPQMTTPVPVSTPYERAYYASCKEARAAGVAPIYRGQPGYRPGLDRDSDGIACE